MGYKLCTAEKPSVARDIAAVVGADEKKQGYFIGNGYIVTWAVGHLVGLAEPEAYGFLSQKEMWDKNVLNKEKAFSELPLIPENFKTVVLPKTKDQFNIMKELMHRDDVDLVIDCGDMGAEGHILQWLIREKAKCTKQIKRFCATSMTEEAIKKSMENLRPIEDFSSIIQGEFCKKKADWIMGMSLSRCCSIKYSANISVGRVQSPTLYFIVKRFFDVNNFKIKDFYELQADFDGFKTFLAKSNNFSSADIDESGRLINKAVAEQISTEIKSLASGKVTFLETKNKAVDRPQLYDITELQRDANRLFGYTADSTLKLAQSLYEIHKILSYPRTDSRYITSDLVPYMQARIEMLGAISQYENVAKAVISKGLNIDKKIVDDSKVTDHHALIVTEKIENFNISTLNPDEMNILHLVISRMLLAFSAKFTYKETVVNITFDNGFIFSASGKIPVSQGFKAVQKALLGKIVEDVPHSEEEQEEQIFPNIELGQKIPLKGVSVLAKKTSPPKLHTEATLLTAMENAGAKLENGAFLKGKGIGTQATRAAIIKALFDKKYIAEKVVGKTHFLLPTKLGLNIIKVLPTDLYSPQITADWEEKISKIVAKEMTETEFLNDFETFICAKIEQVKETKIEADFSLECNEIAKCPFCGKSVVEGKFVNKKTNLTEQSWYCSQKDCKFFLAKSNPLFVARTGKTLSLGNVKSLIEKGTVEVACTSKNGVSYKGIFKLIKNEKGYASLMFEFAKKK
ncbi:MAG: DNA topoisomerase [Oscillospiraceae bacterium]